MSYRVTVKKNLIIFHSPDDWEQVLDRIAQDFGERYRMRHIMKRKLGFTARDHMGLEPNSRLGPTEIISTREYDRGYHYQAQVHLDFYSEPAQSFFVLKYL
jgi:hypothetical protein